MSSCKGLMYLLVLLGAAFASCKPGDYVSKNLRDTLMSIENDLKLSEIEIGINPLFDSIIKSISNSCQKQDELKLMNATLDVYMRIFSNIFQHSQQDKNSGVLDHLTTTERSKVLSALVDLKREMEELKSLLSQKINKSAEYFYDKLNNMNVNDPKVQRKALAEFLQIYQTASVVYYSANQHQG